MFLHIRDTWPCTSKNLVQAIAHILLRFSAELNMQGKFLGVSVRVIISFFVLSFLLIYLYIILSSKLIYFPLYSMLFHSFQLFSYWKIVSQINDESLHELLTMSSDVRFTGNKVLQARRSRILIGWKQYKSRRKRCRFYIRGVINLVFSEMLF